MLYQEESGNPGFIILTQSQLFIETVAENLLFKNFSPVAQAGFAEMEKFPRLDNLRAE
jgi:hypothetical protein